MYCTIYEITKYIMFIDILSKYRIVICPAKKMSYVHELRY